MGMKLLIAYDGSECADAALDGLTRAGLPSDVEARVLSVAEVWLPPPPAFEHDRSEPLAQESIYAKAAGALREAEALSEQARRRLSTLFPTWTIVAEADAGSPAWEIVFRADEWKPDLVVVGSHGRTGIGRFVLGSVSQRVLAEARSSVRIARGPHISTANPVRVLLGIDGSAGSQEAAAEAGRREWPAFSELHIVIVDDPLVPTFVGNLLAPITSTIEDSNREERLWAEKVLSDCAEKLERPGLKVTTEILEGDPKHELPRLAEEWKADCIFVGSQGFSNRLERFVLGSVSAAVAARAHCSVEVVRKRQAV